MIDDRPLTASSDNVYMWRLGEAAREAMDPSQKAGDPIDRGLILLRILNEKGFDVRVRDEAVVPITRR